MKKFALAPALVLTLALAACGSADDASTAAEADTVEMPADEAMADVNEAPVVDPSANATDPAAEETATVEATAQEAGENAAEVAARAQAAAAAAESATEAAK